MRSRTLLWIAIALICEVYSDNTEEPTYKNCTSSDDCLPNEICLLDFCNNSKCSCDEDHLYDGTTCISKRKFGEECKYCNECSTWQSVCDKLQDKPFTVCTCRQGYFYDAITDSCTNIEPCPADSSFVFSRKDNVCYGINDHCDNCTNWNNACSRNDSVPLKFVGNIREHMIDRLWSYGFYSSSNALELDENHEQVMLLLSTTLDSTNSKDSKATWYWPDGEVVSIGDIDDTEWNSVSNNAANISCLYMQYDSCHSKIKTSKDCPFEKVYRGCLIKLPSVYCNEDIDERNTKWEFTEGGTILEKNCSKGYAGTVLRECTKYGEFKTPFYNCTLILFKNVSNLLESGNVSVPDALAAVSSEVEHRDDTYIGDLIEIQKILEVVGDLSENVTISENTTQDYFATASFLLDNEKNGKEWNSRIGNDGKGAEDILPNVEHFAQQVAKSLLKSNKSSLVLTQSNLVLTYAAVDTNKPDVDDISFPTNLQDNPEWNDTKTVSLSLKVASFSDQGVEAFTSLLYRNLSQSIPKTLQGKSNTSEVDINSQVVSFQLLPEAPKILNPELELVFHGFKDMTSKEQHCSYLTTDSDDGGLWSTKGCRKTTGNSTVVKCKCNHLTNFALLISPYKPPEKHESILGIITIVGSSISGLFIFITLALHIAHWRLMKSDKTILIITLCIMFLICYVLFLAGVSQTSNKTACTAIAVTLHYVFLVLFFLMLAEGATVFITVTFPFHRKSHIKEFLIVAFVLPLIITVAVAAGSNFEGYGNENNCWLTQGTWLFWMFAGPASFVILANFITIGLFFRRLFATKASHLKSMKEKAKMTSVAIGVLTPVMGLTWVFGILSVNEETLWLQYVFCLFNSFQGVLVFLFHCVGNKQLRRAMKVSKERKQTVKEVNSELKDKIKRKFTFHSHTTTESNFSTETDHSDVKSKIHTNVLQTLSENEVPAKEGERLYNLQERVNAELKGKLSEMFDVQNGDKSENGHLAIKMKTDINKSVNVADTKAEVCDVPSSCLCSEDSQEKVERPEIQEYETDLATELKQVHSSSDDSQCLIEDYHATASNDTTSKNIENRSGSVDCLTSIDEEVSDERDRKLSLTLDTVSTKQEDENIDANDEQVHINKMLNADETNVPKDRITELYLDKDSSCGNSSYDTILLNIMDDETPAFEDKLSTMPTDDAAVSEDDGIASDNAIFPKLETGISIAEIDNKFDDSIEVVEYSTSSETAQCRYENQTTTSTDGLMISDNICSKISTMPTVDAAESKDDDNAILPKLETDISIAEIDKKFDVPIEVVESSTFSETAQCRYENQATTSTDGLMISDNICSKISAMSTDDAAESKNDDIESDNAILPKLETDISIAEIDNKFDDSIEVVESSTFSETAQCRYENQATTSTDGLMVSDNICSKISTMSTDDAVESEDDGIASDNAIFPKLEVDISIAEIDNKIDDSIQVVESSTPSETAQCRSENRETNSTDGLRISDNIFSESLSASDE